MDNDKFVEEKANARMEYEEDLTKGKATSQLKSKEI
uniref:Uncharacterized protein n=1 Tax=Nelumbo nucifera TaxID=4432 RepID=A0A822Y450_NELNU|nr:TPA_asm: hypothetical protein HUJ06_027464 [Nelumbo nucifera]